MRIAFKLALDLSKSQIKALKRQGVVVGLDLDDPPGRLLVKRVLAQTLDQGLRSIFVAAPFPVTTAEEDATGQVDAIGYTGPPGSAPVEAEPPQPPQPRRVRRPRADASQAEAS